MGLFINSHLHSLNMHKRLTELEKLSEISTGIIALKNMVERGDKLDDRRQALDNLTRILPMLSMTQQQYVLDEIFTPLMSETNENGESFLSVNDFAESSAFDESEGAGSDYEMEFQLTLKRQAHYLDLKKLNRDQRDFRHEQELEKLRKERDRKRDELLNLGRDQAYKRVEEEWSKLQLSDSPIRKKRLLQQFLFRFGTGLGKTHPKIREAHEMLKGL